MDTGPIKKSTVEKLAELPPKNPQTVLVPTQGKIDGSAKKTDLPNEISFPIMAKIPFDRITVPADVRRALDPYMSEPFIVIIRRKYARGSELKFTDNK